MDDKHIVRTLEHRLQLQGYNSLSQKLYSRLYLMAFHSVLDNLLPWVNLGELYIIAEDMGYALEHAEAAIDELIGKGLIIESRELYPSALLADEDDDDDDEMGEFGENEIIRVVKPTGLSDSFFELHKSIEGLSW